MTPPGDTTRDTTGDIPTLGPPQVMEGPVMEGPASATPFPDLVSGVMQCGEVCLIGGSRGVGKTALDTWIRSLVASGESFLGHATNVPPWWGLVILDRGKQDRAAWCQKAGIAMPPAYCLMDDPDIDPLSFVKLTKTGAFKLLNQWIDRLSPPPGGYLSIDPGNLFSGDDKFSYYTALGCGLMLSRIAKERQIGILAYMHGGKQKAQDSYLRLTDRIIGSTGFLGSVGTVCYLASREETNDVNLQWFSIEAHHSEPELWKLRRTPSGLFQIAEKTERQHAEALPEALPLLKYIGDDWGPIAAVRAMATDTPKTTFYRHIDHLKALGLIEITKKGREIFVRRRPGGKDES